MVLLINIKIIILKYKFLHIKPKNQNLKKIQKNLAKVCFVLYNKLKIKKLNTERTYYEKIIIYNFGFDYVGINIGCLLSRAKQKE